MSMSTMGEHIDDFVAELQRRKFRPNTIRAYTSDLRIVARHLAMPLDQITCGAIEIVFDALVTSPTTAARHTARLNRFFV